MSDDPMAVCFVAYVYPGWHDDPYRPGVNEWERLASFEPYFDGHDAHTTPLAGHYDDSDPDTAARQLRDAAGASISAFSYFTYFVGGEFVMDVPMRHALAQAGAHDMAISCTWCLRLPHPTLPVDDIAADDQRHYVGRATAASLQDRAVADLTIADARALLGDDLSAITIRVPRHDRGPSPQRHGAVLAGSDCARQPSRRWDPSSAVGRPEEGTPFPVDQFEALLAALAPPATSADAASLAGALGPLARSLTVAQLAELTELAGRSTAAAVRLGDLEDALRAVA